MEWWKKKWVLILGSILFLLLSGTGYLYYQIASIDLKDIQKRVEERNKQANDNQTNDTNDSKVLPGVLSGTVDKATSLASKPIDTQDALDVAAILLKSGLSMKEMYYLTGKSTDKLSNEDKQKIRDLLLAKLTEEDITALRAITKDYGKNLVILDPTYPIELVGVYDEAERAKIKQELAKNAKPTGTPQPTSLPVNAALPSASPMQSTSPSPVLNTNKELHTQIESKLLGIQSSCTAKVNSLLSEILQSMGNNATLETLQNTYFPKIADAEAQCDIQFNQLMAEAAGSVLPESDINTWRRQYETAKELSRSQAISQLIVALKK